MADRSFHWHSFKQTIANACGTFALLHALSNCGVELEDGPLKQMFAECVDKVS